MRIKMRISANATDRLGVGREDHNANIEAIFEATVPFVVPAGLPLLLS